MGTPEENLRALVMEQMRHKDEKLELYFRQTSSSLQSMAEGIKEVSKAVAETSRQHARYEERQTSHSERMERIEQTQKAQGREIKELHDGVRTNTILRRGILWVSGIIVAAMISGGVLFGNITGKGPS